MSSMDRASFVKKTGAALAVLLIPLPRLSSPKPDAAAVLKPSPWLEGTEYESPEGMVGINVGRGNAQYQTFVSPEFLEDAAIDPVAFLARRTQDEFLRMQDKSPGRATLPVRARGRYRLVDSNNRPLEEYESSQWQHLADGGWTLMTRLIDA